MESLSDHAVIMDRAQLTSFRAHHERVPKPVTAEQAGQVAALKVFLDSMPPGHPSVPALQEAVRQGSAEGEEYVAPLEEAAGDLHHLGGQRFVEVAYACQCGELLAKTPGELPEAWAKHAAPLTGLPEGILKAHSLKRLYGMDRASAACECGAVLTASDKDPLDPGLAVAAWEAHVRWQV